MLVDQKYIFCFLGSPIVSAREEKTEAITGTSASARYTLQFHYSVTLRCKDAYLDNTQIIQ